MVPGRADISIKGPASIHGTHADRLEAFARPLLLAALYLQSDAEVGTRSFTGEPPSAEGAGFPGLADEPDDRAFRCRLAEWFRQALVTGSDASSPQYFGPDSNFHQHHVEMGLLSIALQLAREQLWEPLSRPEKDQVLRWLASCRGSGIVNNNHLFMSVHILEFLGRQGWGHRTDRAVVTAHLDQLETMYRGGGWFEDGMNQAFDHYNAYAFHFYGLWWVRLHGADDPGRTRRWNEWAHLFVDDYQHFFAASGEHPAFGRSISYRFNASGVFAMAAAEGCTAVPLGRLRRLCTRNVDFFLGRPITQDQGCLALGFVDHFDKLAECYSCAASPYWCAKGFVPLIMPPHHAFWTEEEQTLPSEDGDFVRPVSAAGLLVRGIGGAVEVLNAGSMASAAMQSRDGAWKWSKLAYRTGVGFTLAKGHPGTNWSVDSALTQQLDDGRVFGRHSTVCVEMDDTHVGFVYNLGGNPGQINTSVETYVWWRAGWLLQVHHITARQPVVLCLGGYALPIASTATGSAADSLPPGPLDGEVETRTIRRGTDAGILAFLAPDGVGTALQPLLGFAAAGWDVRLDDRSERVHIYAPYHATPVLKTHRTSGALALVAIAWCGSDRSGLDAWSVESGTPGQWRLTHPKLDSWDIAHDALPALPRQGTVK